jgi:tetratricopeptide (TPR) repeat protein
MVAPVKELFGGAFAVGGLLLASCVYAVAQDASVVASQRYAAQGQAALAQGRYEDAEKAFEKLRELEPSVAEAHANLGLVYFQERKFEQALPVLRQALKLKPSLVRSESLLAMSMSELGRYGEATPHLEKCFQRSSDAEIKRMCGLQLERAYTGVKRDAKAVEVALELNRLYPDDAEILYQTGKIYGNLAFLTVQKLVHAAPASVWKHLAAAEALESQGSNTVAIIEYRQVLGLEPDRPGIHYRLGRTLLARSFQASSPQDVTDAAAEFERELQVSPSNANAAYELGEIRRKDGKFEEAQKLFALALRGHLDFEEAHLGLASSLLSLQKPEAALDHLQKAMALNPANEITWYRLSQVQKALGNVAEQRKTMAEYRRLHDRTQQQSDLDPIFSPREATKQEVDPNAAQ